MRHDWIFDVLSDLHSYASRNDLPGFARKIEEAMQEMRREGLVDEPAAEAPPSRRQMN